MTQDKLTSEEKKLWFEFLKTHQSFKYSLTRTANLTKRLTSLVRENKEEKKMEIIVTSRQLIGSTKMTNRLRGIKIKTLVQLLDFNQSFELN